MYREVIETVDEVQRQRISEIHVSPHGRTVIGGPPKRCAGLYFIYTSYSIEELQNSGPPPTNSAVPISDLATMLGRLDKIHPVDTDGFRLVYNGIGGYSGSSYDLRTRILQEISTNDPRTGSLCIRQTTLSDLSRWRYSYVLLPTQYTNSDEEPDINAPYYFETEASNLERYWRFHYGWPLLSRE
jgi:hypothetical protein